MSDNRFMRACSTHGVVYVIGEGCPNCRFDAVTPEPDLASLRAQLAAVTRERDEALDAGRCAVIELDRQADLLRDERDAAIAAKIAAECERDEARARLARVEGALERIANTCNAQAVDGLELREIARDALSEEGER